MKALKITAISLFSLFIILFAGLIVAMLVIDPNDHKSLAEDAVREQTGLTLTLGEIGWQFFPTIGLRVNQIALLDSDLPQAQQNLVTADNASVALALMPLLKQDIRVQEISLHTPVIQHITAKDGSTNWDRLTNQASDSTAASQPEENAQKALPDFNIAAVEVSQASLLLSDEQAGKRTQIDNLNLRLSDVALGTPIPLEFGVHLKQNDTLDLNVTGEGQLTVQPDLKRFNLENFELTTDVAKAPGLKGAQTAKLSLTAEANLSEDIAQLHNLALNLGDLNLSADATVNQLTQNPNLKSTIKIANFSPKKWLPKVINTELPAMANPKSLNALALSATVSGPLTGNNPVLQVKPLSITLDDSTLSGEATVNLATQAIESTLNLDKMNIDDYLPPADLVDPETASTPTGPTPSASGDVNQATAGTTAELIPVKTLRPLTAQITFNAQQLTVKGMPIEALTFNMQADAGLINVRTLQAQLLGGKVSTKGSLDVRSDTPEIKLDHATQTIKLHPVLQAFLGKDLADGAVSLSANLATKGNTTDHLLKSLVGNSEFKLEQGTLKGINFTEMAYSKLNEWRPLVSSFIPQDYTQRVPPAFQKDTVIKNLLAKLQFSNGKISTKDLDADIDGSNIQGSGEVDMATMAGTVRLNLKLSEALTNPTLAKLTWPVMCSFSPTTIKPDCDLKSGPVRAELEKMAKRALRDKAKKAISNKLAEELKLESAKEAEAQAKARLKAEEDAAKAKLRAEEERAKEKAAEKVQDALKKLF
jgi:AsmA protein